VRTFVLPGLTPAHDLDLRAAAERTPPTEPVPPETAHQGT
jgi:hypothetical protein